MPRLCRTRTHKHTHALSFSFTSQPGLLGVSILFCRDPKDLKGDRFLPPPSRFRVICACSFNLPVCTLLTLFVFDSAFELFVILLSLLCCVCCPAACLITSFTHFPFRIPSCWSIPPFLFLLSFLLPFFLAFYSSGHFSLRFSLWFVSTGFLLPLRLADRSSD